MQSTRKRRAASLTAEALWTIQMNDSKIANKEKQSFASDRNSKTGKLSNKKKRETSHRKLSSTEEDKLADVMSKKRPRTASNNPKKNKPMASVVPVLKSVDPMPERPAKNISIALDNPHLLLLPVSVNDVNMSPVSVLALHPSMNLNLLNCFGTSSSPIVNVRSLMPRPASELTQHVPHANAHNSVRDFTSAISGSMEGHRSESQTEPLNLKLGESSIPSFKSFLKASSHNSTRIMSKPINVMHKGSANKASVHGIRKNFPKIKTKVLNERYETCSPSSESSCSSEFDSFNGKHKSGRARRRSINLRDKAARPDDIQPPRCAPDDSLNAENNAWTWEGQSYCAMVFSIKSARPVMRRCYPSMRRKSDGARSSPTSRDTDDVVMVRDCVVMRADASEQPYIAKVVAMWEESTGNMMITLLWYYRPEHTEDPKVHGRTYNPNELFASRHLDEVSVACVEEKGYVLTYNEYCRYRASDSAREDHIGVDDGRLAIPTSNIKSRCSVPPNIDDSLVYFCQRYYDIKSHRLLKQYPNPAPLYSGHAVREDKISSGFVMKASKS